MNNQAASPKKATGVFDFFISYKQKDSAALAKALRDVLTSNGAEVWLDQEEMRPGESILAGIESGIKNSVDAVIILSENYFTGWSEQERRNLYALMVSNKMRIVPVWNKLTLDEIEALAPMFAGIVAIPAITGDENEAKAIGEKILDAYSPKQRESRLYELFFRAVRKHVPDPDLDLFWASLRTTQSYWNRPSRKGEMSMRPTHNCGIATTK